MRIRGVSRDLRAGARVKGIYMKKLVIFAAVCISALAQSPAAQPHPAQTPKATAVPQKSATKPAAGKSTFDKAAIESYLRYTELWIPQVAVAIDDPKPSAELPGFSEVWVHLSYNGGTKDDMYYLSSDGKKVVKGQAYDLTKNPFHTNLELLKTADQPAYGAAAGSPVTLVVFSDFECPVCQQEATVLRKNIPATYGDKVRVYFTDFPLESIHPWSRKAAVAGRCMYHEGESAFWDYHDWIYANQSSINPENVDAKIQEYAKGKGMDGMQLGRCLDDKSAKSATAEVDASLSEGHMLQVSATPTLYLNGRKLEGAVDWQVLTQLIQIEIDHQAEVKQALAAKPAAAEECCVVTIPSLVKK